MITVVYHRDLNRLEMEGHAQSGDVGHDLVCASASILAYTLASFVENMRGAGQTKHPTIKLSDGHALIDCNAPNRYKGSVKLAFDTVCAGFELLARDYPDNISYEIRGKI
jgi:uncharacterized protein YsxB (DUF464 family)